MRQNEIKELTKEDYLNALPEETREKLKKILEERKRAGKEYNLP